jgi:hypothetical protein
MIRHRHVDAGDGSRDENIYILGGQVWRMIVKVPMVPDDFSKMSQLATH